LNQWQYQSKDRPGVAREGEEPGTEKLQQKNWLFVPIVAGRFCHTEPVLIADITKAKR